MYTLSIVMKTIPVGITYASFAGLCIIATTIVGVYKFNQMPDLYTIIGLTLIISGVLIVNLLGKTGLIYVLMIQRAGFPNGDNSLVRKGFQQAAVDEFVR